MQILILWWVMTNNLTSKNMNAVVNFKRKINILFIGTEPVGRTFYCYTTFTQHSRTKKVVQMHINLKRSYILTQVIKWWTICNNYSQYFKKVFNVIIIDAFNPCTQCNWVIFVIIFCFAIKVGKHFIIRFHHFI